MLHVTALCHVNAMVFGSVVRTAPVRFFRVHFLSELNVKLHLSDRIHTSILLSRTQPVHNIQYDTMLEGAGSMHADKTGLAKMEMHFEKVDGIV